MSIGPSTLGDAGEFGFLQQLRKRLPQGADVLVGPGDDAALVTAPGAKVLASTDFMIEGRHFRRDWSGAYDIGRRAAARSLADIAAMGGRATALLVALGAPADLPVEWALTLADGLRDEALLVDASVVGGDTSQSDHIVIVVTSLGTLDDREPVLRSGARPGDVVAVCGRLGWAAAGLAVLGRGFRSPRVVVDALRRPETDYAAGPEAASLGAAALIDVSDGLIADLGHVAEASRVVIDINPKAFDIPRQLQDVGSALNVDPLTWILTGGDDHAFAACFPSDVALPEHWVVVGAVHAVSNESEARDRAGVTVAGAVASGRGGHEHFRR